MLDEYSVVEKCFDFALLKHKGQKYGNTDYFTGHIVKVYERAKILTSNQFNLNRNFMIDVLCAAILHDILEDTDATYDDVLKLTNSYVADTVKLLTKEKGESRITNTTKIVISNNLCAVMVKYCDSGENYNNSSRDETRTNLAKQYAINLEMLATTLKYHEINLYY